jgi:hypothetical protein
MSRVNKIVQKPPGREKIFSGVEKEEDNHNVEHLASQRVLSRTWLSNARTPGDGVANEHYLLSVETIQELGVLFRVRLVWVGTLVNWQERGIIFGSRTPWKEQCTHTETATNHRKCPW